MHSKRFGGGERETLPIFCPNQACSIITHSSSWSSRRASLFHIRRLNLVPGLSCFITPMVDASWIRRTVLALEGAMGGFEIRWVWILLEKCCQLPRSRFQVVNQSPCRYLALEPPLLQASCFDVARKAGRGPQCQCSSRS